VRWFITCPLSVAGAFPPFSQGVFVKDMYSQWQETCRGVHSTDRGLAPMRGTNLRTVSRPMSRQRGHVEGARGGAPTVPVATAVAVMVAISLSFRPTALRWRPFGAVSGTRDGIHANRRSELVVSRGPLDMALIIPGGGQVHRRLLTIGSSQSPLDPTHARGSCGFRSLQPECLESSETPRFPVPLTIGQVTDGRELTTGRGWNSPGKWSVWSGITPTVPGPSARV